jgi:hypothetical protein
MTTHNNPLNVSLIMAVVVVAVSVLVATVLGLQKVDTFLKLQEQQLRNEAIDQCATASRYVYTDTSDKLTKVTEEPSQNFFSECLKLKNIK